MNETLKPVIVGVSGGNVRNHHISLRGAFGLFPDDSLGGSHVGEAGCLSTLHMGGESVESDIDAGEAIFREQGAVRRFFSDEGVQEGDLILIQRSDVREYQISKASKRAFKHHL